MKKLMAVLCLLTSFSSLAATGLLPGLWKVSLKIKAQGQTIEPAKVIKENMEGLSPQEQEQMKQDLMEHVGMDENGKLKVCYTPADFDQQEATITQMGDNCLSRVMKSTRSKVISNFACLDGSRGINTWFINGPRSYTGVTMVISPLGEQSEIIYEGRYQSPYCEPAQEQQVVI